MTKNTFKIQGTLLLAQPTTHQWKQPVNLASDGQGFDVYSSVFDYEMKWDFMTMEEYQQLDNFWKLQSATGTLVVSLPQYAYNPYTFFDYTGCVVHRPYAGDFFENYVSNTVLVVSNIRIGS